MAKNPFVDGITNLAIPDSLNGVCFADHRVKRSLFGIEAAVLGNADLSGMTVLRNAYLTGMKVSRNANLRGMNVSKDLYLGMKASEIFLNGMDISRNAYLDGMNVDILYLSRDTPCNVKGCLDLSNTVILSIITMTCEEGVTQEQLRVGSYKINNETRIPRELRMLLSQYRRV